MTRDLTRRVEQVMGMPISLAMSGRHAGTATGELAWAKALVTLRAADAVFSTYRENSAINRLARGELRLECCPPEVREVFDLAEIARAESRGAFDIRRPSANGDYVLDPSGIVKGWAVDRAARVLRDLDGTDFCLAAGGDMVCHTVNDDAPDWRIGIENPADPSAILATIPLRNGGIATSGLVHRGAHISDPRSGGSTPARFASVTIVAPTLTSADVDATAAFVLGGEGPDWIRTRPDRAALFVNPDGTTEAIGFGAPAPAVSPA